MTDKEKDTVYIDIDDEITGIIDKVKGSGKSLVTLVLPKRAGVFQSIVNMKLLKRAADDAKKNLVLVTSESGLLPLAGAAGIHVAKTLTSKPEIPLAPKAIDDTAETVKEDSQELLTAHASAEPLPDKQKTIGQLAGSVPPPPPADGGIETLKLDNEDLPLPAAEASKKGAKGSAKTFEPPSRAKKSKKLHIPNFRRFRLWLALGILLLILIIGGFAFATFALPKATINIKTDATNVNTNIDFSLSTKSNNLDPVNNIVPAKLASQQKTYTQQVPTTGQENNGNKASGTVTMTVQYCGGNIPSQPPQDVPAGTGLSANNLTYITQQDTAFDSNNPKFSKGCLTFTANGSTPIIAQSGGSNYNTGNGTPFTVAGRSDVSASGSASGGTDNIVQTVNQNDINSAKSKISTGNPNLKQTLESQLKGDNLYPIVATYQAGTPNVTTSANVGDVANTVTVTETITYSMFGAKQSDLNTLIDNQVKSQIDTSQQSVLDTGLSSAGFNVNTTSGSGAQINMTTKATAGPNLNITQIKKQAAGQKAGPIKSQLGNNPDITSVSVNISPFWVTTVPKNTSRITVHIDKPTSTANAKTSSSSGSNH